MLDLLINGGEVIDGTGSERRRADVGIKDDRVVVIGETDEPAARTIDAQGSVVAPGFVDIHTHFDAQAFWDPDLSPSPLHGVTTVVAGNCGFTIAPLSDEAGTYLMPMLAKVEGMPLASLSTGVPWDWRTTAQYLDAMENRLVINAGFMVGHSAIRRVVMGPAANERSSTDKELAQMVQLLRDGLKAGGMGFSTTTSTTHNDGDGNPVPSRFADTREFLKMAQVTGEYEGTSLELLPKGATDRGGFDEETAELMISMSAIAQRPLNWNVIMATAGNVDSCTAKLAVGDQAAARGAKVVGLTMPIDMSARFSFHSGFVLDVFNGWNEIMNASHDEKMRTLSDPEQRRRLEEQAAQTPGMKHLAAWGDHVLVETFAPENLGYAGRRIGDVAAELGKEPFDTLIDIALADDLRTSFTRGTGKPTRADWEARAAVWNDPRAMVGASDAGAHLDMIAAFRYSTGFLQEAVREQELLSLERAVHLLTGAPARLYGMRDRGLLREGGRADIVIFDEREVGSGPVATRFDLPGGAGRLYADATGIGHVIVNGTVIASGGQYTGDRAGTVLRAGRDTANPTMDV